MIARDRANVVRFEGGNLDDHVLALVIQRVLEERGIVFLAHYGGAHSSARGIAGPDATEPADQQIEAER
jgi:hypothetical protein